MQIQIHIQIKIVWKYMWKKTCYKQLINFFVVVFLWRWKGQLKTKLMKKHKSQFCLKFIKPFESFLVFSFAALGLGRCCYIVLYYINDGFQFYFCVFINFIQTRSSGINQGKNILTHFSIVIFRWHFSDYVLKIRQVVAVVVSVVVSGVDWELGQVKELTKNGN